MGMSKSDKGLQQLNKKINRIQINPRSPNVNKIRLNDGGISLTEWQFILDNIVDR